MTNYDPNGPTVGDFVLRGGLEGRVFVNMNNGCRPYIFTGKPNSNGQHRDHVEIGYVTLGCSEVEVHRDQNRRLQDHLRDPLYDPGKIDATTPTHQVADMELVRRFMLRGVGD